MLTGMLVVVSSPKSVAASAADFDLNHQGGFTIADAQERRARSAAWRKVYCEFCYHDIGEAICASALGFESIRTELLKRGWSEHSTAVECPAPGDGSGTGTRTNGEERPQKG